MTTVEDLFNKASAISGENSHGNVTLYLMRYRQNKVKECEIKKV
ncbi:hypothetical protein [Leuconostoc mesenteroides]|nr:hypothetical protein [Leuconostoc mesenteroides]